MKLTIPLRDGTTLMFEGTSDELNPIADKMMERHGPMIGSSNCGEALPDRIQQSNVNRRWTEQSVRKLWGLLYGEQKKLVKFLIDRGGKATYQEIQKHMGYGAQHLSGILSPITRNAQTATNDRLARLVDWHSTGKGTREYVLDPVALSLLQQVVKQP